MDLLPASRSSIGYYYHGTNYVVHPGASFTLDQRDGVERARDRQLPLRRQPWRDQGLRDVPGLRAQL